jgi:class 3 adenylate cyclase
MRRWPQHHRQQVFTTPPAGSARDVRPIQRQHRAKLRPIRMLTENKQVSVLFVDVCNSTSLLEHADPEESRDYLRKALTYWSTRSKPWRHYRQLLGDGLVALSGAPLAQEDHALRACMAALKMQRATIPDCDARGFANPTFRIGINPVRCWWALSDNTNGHTMVRTARPSNIASRLDMAPGGITLALRRSAWLRSRSPRPVGVRSVRGLAAPIELHEVLVETESSAAAPLTRKQQWRPRRLRRVVAGTGACH